MSVAPTEGELPTVAPGNASLPHLLDGHPATPDTTIVHMESGSLTLAELRDAVARVAAAITSAGIRPGHAVGGLVGSGPAGVVVMFAVWTAGAVYIPINRRAAPREVAGLISETAADMLLGTPEDLDRQHVDVGMVELDESTWDARVRRPRSGGGNTYAPDVAMVLRTSGTTGKPKAVLLRHQSTIDALDSSLRKLARRRGPRPRRDPGATRVNLIPLSLALWSGIFNTLFALRAGFGVVLLERFSPNSFASAVRAHGIKSTVLPPAMISALCDSDVESLAPLEIVRSITAPLSPATARRFRDRFGVLVLNSYGQTELGGEVVGWTIEDIRRFGDAKLGAAGRPYDDVDVRILDDDRGELGIDQSGHIHIRSPFRMRGYATGGSQDPPPGDRFVDGFLSTGDIGRLDTDGFLWIEGRVSDMINRGGLKVFPDEVEEVLRRHPAVREAAVAGVPDSRLGEVPYAWIVAVDGESVDGAALAAWCRQHLAPYKIPVEFLAADELPRSDLGKLLRRELRAGVERP
ncbi:class I adenylate-forming enzyme family protein [Phytohabitans kaempferiae]|uniref:Class I adenylate-forming enzyme family protein n=1 Tax=Phytohabitans kaempferiae TaxID=1620943 RepID=A0ABV6LY77_9ACTN